MKKYKVAQVCEQELARLDGVEDKTKVEVLRQRQAVAVAEAVQGIADLNQEDIKKKLLGFASQQASGNKMMVITHEDQFLRSGDPLFWCMCCKVGMEGASSKRFKVMPPTTAGSAALPQS